MDAGFRLIVNVIVYMLIMAKYISDYQCDHHGHRHFSHNPNHSYFVWNGVAGRIVTCCTRRRVRNKHVGVFLLQCSLSFPQEGGIAMPMITKPAELSKLVANQK